MHVYSSSTRHVKTFTCQLVRLSCYALSRHAYLYAPQQISASGLRLPIIRWICSVQSALAHMRIKIAHTILWTYQNEQRLTARTYLGRRPPQTGKALMQKLLWAQMQTRESAPTSHHGVKNLQAAGFTAVHLPFGRVVAVQFLRYFLWPLII